MLDGSPRLESAVSIRQARLQRLERVRDLHMEGLTIREIADDLQTSRLRVQRDLADVKARLQRQGQRHAVLGRVRSINMYSQVQHALWDLIDSLPGDDEHKLLATLARAVTDSQKAIDTMTERLRDELPEEIEITTVRDAVARMDPDDLEARRRRITEDPDFEPPPLRLRPQFTPGQDDSQNDANDGTPADGSHDV